MDELTIEQAMQKIVDLQNDLAKKDSEVTQFKTDLEKVKNDKEVLQTSNNMLKDINRTYYTQLNQQFKDNTPIDKTKEDNEIEVLSLDDIANNF